MTLEPWHWEDIKGTEIGPESFGTCEKQVPGVGL